MSNAGSQATPNDHPGPHEARAFTRLGAGAVVFAALAGGSAVALGAWASHGAAEPAKSWLATAAQYQMLHAVAMLAAVTWRERLPGRWPRRLAGMALALFAAGVVLFCGALVGLSLGHSWGGAAPAGGFALMAGWLALAVAGLVTLLKRR